MNDTGRGKVGFWVLIGMLAASGITMAFIVVFGLLGTTAYSVVWRVFVADLYLIASLAAQHSWLRRTAWIGTGVTLVLGIVNVFWQYTPYYQWANDRTHIEVGDYNSGWSPWFGFEEVLESAAHVALIGVILLGFISLAYRWVANERVLRAIYIFTFVSGLASILLGVITITGSEYRWNVSTGMRQVLAGIFILALTAAAIVIIAAFVQRKAALAQARAEQSAKAMAGAVNQPPSTVDVSGRVPTVHSEQPVHSAGISDDELRVLVRKHVDEYLLERGL